MNFNFNADDILRMAEQIEVNGIAYYKKASEIVSQAGYKKILKELSAMETEHRDTFSSMRNMLSSKEKEPTVFDPGNESAQYLKALADMEIFYGKQPGTNSIETILIYTLRYVVFRIFQFEYSII